MTRREQDLFDVTLKSERTLDRRYLTVEAVSFADAEAQADKLAETDEYLMNLERRVQH